MQTFYFTFFHICFQPTYLLNDIYLEMDSVYHHKKQNQVLVMIVCW